MTPSGIESHDLVLLYIFRTAWVLFHSNILTIETKSVSETSAVLKTWRLSHPENFS